MSDRDSGDFERLSVSYLEKLQKEHRPRWVRFFSCAFRKVPAALRFQLYTLFGTLILLIPALIDGCYYLDRAHHFKHHYSNLSIGHVPV